MPIGAEVRVRNAFVYPHLLLEYRTRRAQTPIVLTQRHDAAEGDSTDCRDTYERAEKNSIMSGRRIVKQALACLHNSTALAGMIAQQSFPLNFGGTNHAEAAHAKLSQALGPGNCLSVDMVQQRLELHALIHNQQKARRLGVGKLDKRKQAQQSLLDEYERLVGSTFERSLTNSSHPLCTGPVFYLLTRSAGHLGKQKYATRNKIVLPLGTKLA